MQVSFLFRAFAGEALSDVAEHPAVVELRRIGLIGETGKLTRRGLNRACFYEMLHALGDDGLSQAMTEAVKNANETEGKD